MKFTPRLGKQLIFLILITSIMNFAIPAAAIEVKTESKLMTPGESCEAAGTLQLIFNKDDIATLTQYIQGEGSGGSPNFVTIVVHLVKAGDQESTTTLCENIQNAALDALNQEVSSLIFEGHPDITAYVDASSGNSYIYIYIYSMRLPSDESIKTWIKIGLPPNLVGESTIIYVNSRNFEAGNKLETTFNIFPTLNVGFTGDKEIGHFQAEGAIPDSERNALIALYNSTNGDNWTRKDSWLGEKGTESDWFGVSCDNGHVVGLSLAANNLDGTLPEELGNLPFLGELSLNDNKLTGSIPASLGNLALLQYLFLGNNQLSGMIPSTLGSLFHLVKLHLMYNLLTGNIPTELGNLSNLECLDLSHNNLGGPIPTELGRLSSLVSMNLMGNQLTGTIPEELGNLTALTYLGLNENHFEGTLPKALGSLAHLTMFQVEKNMLQGPVPSEITRLTSLEDGGSDFRYNALWSTDQAIKDFMNNKQTGADWENTQTVAPANLSASPASQGSVNLTWSPIEYSFGEDGSGYEIYYSENSQGPFNLYGTTADKEKSSFSVTGLKPGTTYYFKVRTKTNDGYNTIFSNFTDIVSATTSEEIPPDIPKAEWDALADFYNSTGGPEWKNNDNWLDYSVSPCNWFGIKCENGHIVEIQLMDNNLTGTLPDSMGNFTQLRILNLGNSDPSQTELMADDLPNKISGSIPKVLGTLSNLNTLILRKNKFTGDIPPELGNLAELIHLDLDFNLLTGNIPSTLGKLASLEILSLMGNQLTGRIPEELGNLTLLEYLELNDNLLTGNLPEQLGNLSHLKYLILSNNKLIGSIPAQWGSMTSLMKLYLANNLLTGLIPKEIGLLSNLAYMDISNNSFVGPLPSELTNLSNLEDGGSDFRYNSLFIEPPNKFLYEFMNKKQIDYDWLSYQKLIKAMAVESGLTQADFSMISFYINPENPSAMAMFGDDIGIYDTANYRIGWYDPMLGKYVEYGSELMINPGRAIWFFTRKGVTLKVKGNPVSLEKDIDIELKFNPETGDGWNMIGVPNNIYYKWDNIVVVVKDDRGETIETKAISDPGAEDYISRRALWRWKKGEGDYAYYSPAGEIPELANDFDPNPCMEPSAGYWVKASQKNIFLRFKKDAQLDLCVGSDEEETVTVFMRKGKNLIHPAKAFAYGEDSPPMPMNAFAGVGAEDSPVAGTSGCFINSSAPH